ncbi:potassium transporter TrkA [Scytonema sp. UIC 10036]|uniref:potassium channel family protein n=1 Tax=Scytonema sp. UIC 10036 TaxID=2304196 RepID=UPI0012DA7FC0|nr:potassium channel protein [Scytonema sp. UIC 10036]MUH00948.1 potassium transporter TrkA [Scytonema sp. UIC 10036]
MTFDQTETPRSYFLICGLGSLGQYCVAKLKEFGVSVTAIDIALPSIWEVNNVPDLLEELALGDCRQPDVLAKAKIQQCQAVLIVTSDERVNIDTAFAVRVLNQHVRIVIRSSKQNLNELLDRSLGNFTALEATQITASAFAIAALGSEIQGLIELNEHLLRVVKCQVTPNHRWCDRRLVYELNNRHRRVLSHVSDTREQPTDLYQWETDATIRSGDIVTYIESQRIDDVSRASVTGFLQTKTKRNFKQLWQEITEHFFGHSWQQILMRWWQATAQQQTKRVAIIVGIALLGLLALGTIVLKATYLQESWLRALYVTGVMLLGSYDTVFGALNSSDTIPLWMRLMNWGYMLAGTASIAVLYALLTESLLAAKFQLVNKRPPIPQEDHVILIGLGNLGRQVATLLMQLQQPLVGVSHTTLEPNVLPQMPLAIDDFTNAFTKVNLATAKSIVVTTDDEIANLEMSLMAHTTNPESSLVIRTFDPRFSKNLAQILPDAEVLCVYSLAAEAFTAAAFGENILNLFRLHDQTVLVAEYNIQSDDPLCGLLLAEVAYGYSMMPILYHKSTQFSAELMPSDDIQLQEGDRLVVLQTIHSLQRLERGDIFPRLWQVQIDRALTKDAVFDGARTIARISGCGLDVAAEVMNNLPTVLPIALYKLQAQRLVRELNKVQTKALAIPVSTYPHNYSL